ncbi:MAG: phosphoribosylformylglycinamidine synthase [Bacillota bacterium]|nr:phosphoribosylformylglycinamidine synthase [Bacillota bacterium]
MIQRIYVEKKPGFDQEARQLRAELAESLGITGLDSLRLINRYDIEGLTEAELERALWTVFAEAPVDLLHRELPAAGYRLVVEYLPGQYDQRADAAAQCAQFVIGGERPRVRHARVWLLDGELTAEELGRIRSWLVNPVDSHVTGCDLPASLIQEAPQPAPIPVYTGFRDLVDTASRSAWLSAHGFAMSQADLACCVDYFRAEGRDPSQTELRVLDTYWSDHCRHTTFQTELVDISSQDPAASRTLESVRQLRRELGRDKRPLTLMELATIGMRALRAAGRLEALDVSEEVNACTVRVRVDVDGRDEEWLLLFKNETHNHPTEIEPFGGAATCLGGAIRDPLSGRGYVYQAMRVSGAGDPTQPIDQTLPGKLPQLVICREAARGYASYGNQIGLATGLVDEIYHPGYVAKRMELGAVIAAAPAAAVVRARPEPGDLVLLVGGRTGRDGLGGATGSSQAHDESSLESSGAEVQKGNAPEERKLQRLFRRPEATRLIRRSNDFGAGGVAVAVGELADGLDINLDAVPAKYDGLDGTELAISESQERMAVVVRADDAESFAALAAEENLECTRIAVVTEESRLVMHWRGERIVDLAREFLDTNGARRHASVEIQAPAAPPVRFGYQDDWQSSMQKLVSDLAVASRRGLIERFDSTIGAATLLLPLGGSRQLTPAEAMAARLPVLTGETTSASLMAYAYDPWLTQADPWRGGRQAVCEAVGRIVAAGGELERCWLSLQEFFPRLGEDPARWGLPTAALLGAVSAQLDLGLAAIGGKDSMSGSFEDLDVPPTLVAFAVAMTRDDRVRSPEFRRAGSTVWLVEAPSDDAELRAYLERVAELLRQPGILSAALVTAGGLARRVFLSAVGNGLGFHFAADVGREEVFAEKAMAFLIESEQPVPGARPIGVTTAERTLVLGEEAACLDTLEAAWETRLEAVYPTRTGDEGRVETISVSRQAAPAVSLGRKPRVLLPVFPGTNGEYDMARAFRRAGAKVETLLIRNLTPAAVSQSLEALQEALGRCQILFLSGGFSGGDEPDGSGKFITSVLRQPQVAEALGGLLARDGLVGGICNGFQALIKLGLLPWGEIRTIRADDPTLTHNAIGRHQSRLVLARVASTASPWLSGARVGDIHPVVISHGEGRFVCRPELFAELAAKGQITTQYVDASGYPTLDIAANPNGSQGAVESLISPDGRIFGRMGHSERMAAGLYRNAGDPGAAIDPAQGRLATCTLFENAVRAFR